MPGPSSRHDDAAAPAPVPAAGATTLDPIDHTLVEALREDGRAALGALGKRVGLSGDAVRERLRRLRAAGVVSVLGTPDPNALGYRTIALVGIAVDGPVLPVAQHLAEVPEIDYVVCTSGGFDVLIEMLAHDDAHLLELLDRHVRAHPHVRSCATFLYLDVLKWRPGGFAVSRIAATSEPVASLDDGDRAIVAALQADGRASYQDIAHATGLTYANARRRARALIESGTVRIITTVNRLVEGTAVMAAVGLRTSGSTPELAAALEAIDEVEVALRTTGPFDVFVDLACRDRRHLVQVLTERLQPIPGVLHAETFVYARLQKLPMQWSAQALGDVIATGAVAPDAG